MDDGLGEAAGVVLEANGLFRFAEIEAADAVDLAEARDGHGGGFGGGRAVAVEDVQLGHGGMIAAGWREARRKGKAGRQGGRARQKGEAGRQGRKARQKGRQEGKAEGQGRKARQKGRQEGKAEGQGRKARQKTRQKGEARERRTECGMAGGVGLEVFEVVEDLGAGPVLGADELAAKDAGAVDDVGFGDLGGAVEGVDALIAVADGDEVDVVAGEELAVKSVVLVDADADDGELGHLFLELEEAGELFDAGGAPGGPEVEDDDAAAEAGEVEGLDAVGDFEEGGGGAEAVGVIAAIAAGGEQQGEGEGA